MRRAIVWTAALLAAGFPYASLGGETLLQAPQLEQVVTTALEEFDVPGAAVGIWTEKGEWTKAFGLANVAAEQPVKLRDDFGIRSVTKSFVVTVVLQLIADSKGSISLDDPIGNYLAGVPNGEGITLRELSNMRSGLFDYTADPEFRQAFNSIPGRKVLLLQTCHASGVLETPKGALPFRKTMVVCACDDDEQTTAARPQNMTASERRRFFCASCPAKPV